jgi:Zn-dependent alcohol dehydrogenase
MVERTCFSQHLYSHRIIVQKGLAVIQGAKMAGASRIIAVDINPEKVSS